MSKLLLINDMAGYGKVALSAMIPVLSSMKYEIYNLPTALVSNTLDYGKFDILETTDYMANTIKVWDELGFEFDAISTGFIVSKKQVELVKDYCAKMSAKGVKVFTDPIMGDNGNLYNGITEKTVELMRELISVADYIVPNYTEAAYLTNISYKENGASIDELYSIVDKLRQQGAKSVVVTSCIVDDGNECVVGYDAKANEYFRIDFKEIPVRFPGTGDIFSSVVMGRVLEGKSLKEATKAAMDTVVSLIVANAENKDKYKGIPVELYLDSIK